MGQAYVLGARVPVTKLIAGPCTVVQILKYSQGWAVQIGFGEKKIKNTTKPLKGHTKSAFKDSKKAPRYLREVKVKDEPKLKVGDKVKVDDIFSEGDVVSVTSVTKGKGFAGVVKRWGFAGGPRTHGQSDRLRAPGSIGQGTTPGRVRKGKKMPGRMGSDKKTVKNLTVVSVNPQDNEITLSGSVPGSRGSFVMINKLSSGKIEDLVKEGPKAQIIEGAPEEEGEGKESEAKSTKEDVSKATESKD